MNPNQTKGHIWLCLTPTLEGPGSYRVELALMPSLWRRFWYRLLLGWHVTRTEGLYGQ